MGEGKTWGQTVLGWFIVQDEGDRSAAGEPGSSSTGAAADLAEAAFSFQSPPPAATAGRVDFDAVFDAAGIDAEERDRVAKAAALVASLPAETPVAVRKQIVEASLKAFGVPIEKIIEAAVSEIQALEAYIRTDAADSNALREQSHERIRQFEEEIQRIRQVVEARGQEQRSVETACNRKKLDIQQVLEFFGQEAVAAVVRASPRLIDPAGGSTSSN